MTKGLATILAIGTANPPNQMLQKDFPDFYFRVTNWGDDTTPRPIKDKFIRLCEKTGIRKRHMFITEEFLKNHPNVAEYNANSLDIRQDFLPIEVPKLAKEAAQIAIQEWAQPKARITHLVFTTTSGLIMPGYDLKLANLLGLGPNLQRFMINQQGCNAGGTALRLCKDIAENNKGSRVLLVCSEITLVAFHGPSEVDFDSLVGQAIFTDGAAAAIIGAADPNPNPNPNGLGSGWSAGERPLFELVSASQSVVPDTERAIWGQLRQAGLKFGLAKDNATLIANDIERPLIKGFGPLGIDDWNSIFWVLHPGGRAILDQVEAKLGLDKDKLRASRHVLSEFGNMSSPTVLFVLDETRKRSVKEGKATTGEGFEYGALFGLGPGITIETVVLRSFPIT